MELICNVPFFGEQNSVISSHNMVQSNFFLLGINMQRTNKLRNFLSKRGAICCCFRAIRPTETQMKCGCVNGNDNEPKTGRFRESQI